MRPKARNDPGVKGFLSLIWRSERGSLSRAVILQTLGCLSEAFSIILLIPLLKLMDPDQKVINLSLANTPLQGILGDQLVLDLPVILLAFVTLVIIRTFLLEFKERYNSKVTFGFVRAFQHRLFDAVTMTRWEVISQYRTSDMSQALTSNVDRLMISLNLLLQFFQSLIMIMIFATLSFFISWQMTSAALIIGALLLLLAYPMRRKSFEHGQHIANHRRSEFKVVESFLQGLRTAKTFGLEKRHLMSMSEVLDRIYNQNITFMSLRARTATVYQISMSIALAAFIYFALVVQSASLAVIITLLFLFMRLAPRIMALHTLTQDFLSNVGAIGSMLSLLQRCEENTEILSDSDHIRPIIFENEIKLDNLGFSYPGSSEPVLEGISACIRAKQITAIVGPSGSGKSTLIDVIMALLTPSHGSIFVDGETLDVSRRHSWQENIAFVPQDTFLFNETVAENLRIARPEASDADLWSVLKQADADDMVRRKPSGLQFTVGDRGLNLSGGERQRIALARALLRQPKLLILDEATSGLDWQSEARIIKAIKSLKHKMAIVIIAHRSSMISFADHVISLGDEPPSEGNDAPQVVTEDSSDLREMMDADRL